MPSVDGLGGGAKKSSTPPPKGLNVKKLERETKRERQNNVERKSSVPIHVPYGGVI